MSKFQDKYRVETTRLDVWDYSSPWWYYVTINTKDHIEYFGSIVNGKMVLNELGKIIEDEWQKTKLVRRNVDLDYYVIMPNHLHGIIILNGIERRDDPMGRLPNNAECEIIKNETMQRIVSTKTLKANSLGSIVGQFKPVCTKRIRALGYKCFSWQSSFYDRIIRNEKELYKIRKYITDNPLKWEIEKNSPENIFDL